MNLYDYLIENYGENESIFLLSLKIPGVTDTNIRRFWIC